MDKLMLSFVLGQRVTTRRIGPPVVGEVRGLVVFSDVEGTTDGELADQIAEWERHYPEWRRQPVLFVAVELSAAEREIEGGTHLLTLYPAADLEVMDS